MHRHGYQGRKLGRETDQRRALLRGLAISLITHGKIQTTLPKAKELRRFVEKLVTKAKKGDLHNRRQIMSVLGSEPMAARLMDVVTPQLGGRNSGYLRIKRSHLRVGDGAQMAVIEFVDTLQPAVADEPVAAVEATAVEAEG